MTKSPQSPNITQSIWYGLLSGLSGGGIAGALLPITYFIIVRLFDFTLLEILQGIPIVGAFGLIFGSIAGSIGGLIGGTIIALFKLTNHHIRLLGPCFGALTALALATLNIGAPFVGSDHLVSSLIAITLFMLFGTFGGHIGSYVFNVRLRQYQNQLISL